MIKFDKKAMHRFNQIPDDIKPKILSNVYCTSCREMVTIIDFEGSMEGNDLILRGKCKNCLNKVVRLIEG